MRNKWWLRAGMAGALVVLTGTAGAQQQSGTLPALARIEKGKWQLRDADGGMREICVKDPRVLLQLFHEGAACQHYLVDSAPGGGTERYVCVGHGTGRSSISVETPRLVSIDTQGVADGQPFSQRFEGRRVGDCS